MRLRLLLLLAALIPAAAFAQSGMSSGQSGVSGGLGVLPFAGAPSGACGTTQLAVNTATGDLYSCNGGVWLKVGPGAGGGAGTVTSVDLTVPSWLAVTGNPVTTAGTLVVAPAAAQTTHKVIGTCNAATTFAPCSLVIGDLPATVVTSAAALASGNVVTGAGLQAAQDSGTALSSLAPLVSPAFTTPNIGAATGASLSVSGSLTSTVATGTAPLVVASTTNVANLNASSLSGATFAAPGAIGGGTAATGTFTAMTASGIVTFSQAGALSAAAVQITGAPIGTGGTATTTHPLVYLNSGAAPTTWSAAGTALGINLPSGSTSNFLDFHLNGSTSIFLVSSGGNITHSGGLNAGTNVNSGATSAIFWSSRSKMFSGADGRINFANNAATGIVSRLAFGPETTSFPAFCNSATVIQVCLGDGTVGASMQAPTYLTSANCTSSAAPAVCAAAAAGSVVVAAAGTTVTVNTTAVTANSQIILTEDSSLGTKLSVTCNTTPATALSVTTRTAATSFVIATNAPTTNPRCISYSIVN